MTETIDELVIVSPEEMNSYQDVQALTLTDEEKLVILQLFGSQVAFLQWQKEALAEKIEQLKSIQISAEYQGFAVEKMNELKDQLPTLYAEVPNDPVV